ncbi:uncharacterized protein LOC128989583 isoform X2 [Macrosteles quadrilineatus]|uniref:uncharacterized protein LOC128989583 isoform X2 n=1 Tax=Macrosteles quadrilineatus TaxID=74068 RepID=UPI0023E30DE4|nr:uncharacterized protein LOC128989583 isoform X2 [Macrosteles quadrilineatus]
MRARPSSSSRSGKSSRTNGKSHSSGSRINRNKSTDKKNLPDLSVLRQPVVTSVNGLRQAVKVFETGTPEVLDLLSYDCDVVYECKVCRNLFRSLANFISHKRVYCTQRYSQSQDLQRANKQGDDANIIIGEKPAEKLPTRITARRDLTSIVEALGGQKTSSEVNGLNPTVHLEPMENTSYGVFQTVLKKADGQDLMRNQVQELQNLLSKNEVVLGPDGRVLQNGLSDLHQAEVEQDQGSDLMCTDCNIKFSNRKTLTKHKRHFHELIRISYSCPCCKNYFANPWGVYRHLYKVHRKTSEQVRRLRSQIHKKEFKIEKPAIATNNGSKKSASPNSKKKAEQEQQQKVLQHNKEWIGHFEDDLRCGGCARKFERKAALISHSQICQKRIAACNRVEPSQAVVHNPVCAVVALSPLPCSKKPMPKPSPEKKIGIQVRMNYCKSPSQGGRALRSITGHDSDVETPSVSGKDSMYNQPNNSDSSVLEQFLKTASNCGSPEGIEKVSSYLSNTLDKVGSYEISTCKRSTFLRGNVGKNKSLEAKCLQLRSTLENGFSERLKGKDKEAENTVYFDGNVDNTSESNTSAVSSLSSQLTPLADKTYIEVEQSIEIKNINISRSLDTPSAEADSTCVTNGGLHMTYRTYTGNIKFSPTKEVTCEEVSAESDYLHDNEVSVNLKPISLKQEIKKWSPGREFENTISILTRNQLKAICKDDMLPVKVEKKVSPSTDAEKKVSPSPDAKKKEKDVDVETLSREMLKRLNKYVDWSKNKCHLCNKVFRHATTSNILRHVRLHTNWKRYECLFKSCTFQAFQKSELMCHVQEHSKDMKGKSLESLVGLIDTSKWSLRLKKTPKLVVLPKVMKNRVKISLNKGVEVKKNVKPARKLTEETVKPVTSGKVKVKLKHNVQNGARKTTLSSILKKNNESKQKLLTDFKNFSGVERLNGKKVPKKKIKTEKSKSPKRKSVEGPVENRESKRLKLSPLQNGIHKKEALPPAHTNLKKKTPENSPEHRNESSTKREIKREGFIVNHITSSQQSNESLNSVNIIDSPSLEEEESQESDGPVDDSHLKEIFMEVIFGSTPSPAVMSPGRPVRNKSRPKRDSDFILGSQKDFEKEDQDIKVTFSRKNSKSSVPKIGSEASSSPKKSK